MLILLRKTIDENIRKGGEIMKALSIYLDGACSGNPGPGGWAAIIVNKNEGEERAFSSYIKESTNNRMYLIATIEVLKKLTDVHELTIYTCSNYIVDTIKNNWHEKWIQNNWKKSNGKKVENQELWVELVRLIKTHKTSFLYAKADENNPYLKECDRLAKLAIQQECDLNI